jgi:hypothetical protein
VIRLFLHEEHAQKNKLLCSLDQVAEHDLPRHAFFYLIAGHEQLFHLVKYVYNFHDDRLFVPHSITDLALSPEDKLALEFAFQLLDDPRADALAKPFSTYFESVDQTTGKLLRNALSIRFAIPA